MLQTMMHTDRIRCCLFVFICMVCLSLQTTVPPGGCAGITFVDRSSWEARSPKIPQTSFPSSVDRYIIHHTVTDECSTQSQCSRLVRAFQNHHMDSLDMDDIAYNFVIGGDGRVHVGRGWDSVGSHTSSIPSNRKSIGVAIIGTYVDNPPDNNLLETLKDLMACGVELEKVDADYSVVPHRDASSTVCPGDAFYKQIKKWSRYSS